MFRSLSNLFTARRPVARRRPAAVSLRVGQLEDRTSPAMISGVMQGVAHAMQNTSALASQVLHVRVGSLLLSLAAARR
jgi:hypothetical protein